MPWLVIGEGEGVMKQDGSMLEEEMRGEAEGMMSMGKATYNWTIGGFQGCNALYSFVIVSG